MHAARRVKSYEGKLAALNAVNSALQKENDQLRAELDEASAPKTDAGKLLSWPMAFVCQLAEQLAMPTLEG